MDADQLISMDRPLVDALLALGGHVRQILVEGDLRAMRGFTSWRVDATNPRLFRLGEDPPLLYLSDRVQQAVKTSEQWSAAIAALRAHPGFGSAIDELTGFGGQLRRHESDQELMAALARIVAADDMTLAAAGEVAEWRRELPPTRRVPTIRPLAGIAVEGPIRFAPGVTLREMTPEELVAVISGGITATPIHSLHIAMAHVSDPWCIAWEVDFQREYGVPPLDAPYALDPGNRLDAALTTLRLVGQRNVHGLGTITILEDGYGYGVTPRAGWRPADLPPVRLREETGLASLYGAIRATSNPALRIAIDRFNLAHEPRQPQDRLVDIWIGLEALLSFRVEVSYKLGLNAANTVAVPGHSRSAIAKWIRDSYNVRNRFVHGTSGKGEPKMTRPDGATAKSLDEHCGDLLWFLAMTIRTVLEHGPLPEKAFDEIALGERRRPGRPRIGPRPPAPPWRR